MRIQALVAYPNPTGKSSAFDRHGESIIHRELKPRQHQPEINPATFYLGWSDSGLRSALARLFTLGGNAIAMTTDILPEMHATVAYGGFL